MHTTQNSGVARQPDGGEKPERPRLHLIEDDSDMRHFLQYALVDTYQISDSPDGLTGYQKVIAELPDVILSDVAMPGMDGLTMCKRLKADGRTRHIPVVLLAGGNSDEQTLAGLESGADDYVLKPFNVLILKAKLRNLINARAAWRQHLTTPPTASPTDSTAGPADDLFLRKAEAIVEQNLNNATFEATDFARAIGMSRAQLYRKLHRLSGQTVKEFVRVIRLKRAVRFITSTEHNVSQAAFEVGFSSVAYFTKAFKDYFGLCPTQYKARNWPKP